MSSVNGDGAAPPAGLVRLLWTVLQRARTDGMALLLDTDPELTGPLTASHARLLDHLPPEGARATDLAVRMRITKQALGQLATQLADRGYVELVGDPSDRRAKLIRWTGRGERARRAMLDTAATLEDRWWAEVGPDRYAVFRAVLAELGRT